ncbi:MAG: indolepyruvate oxidoreductase subunit beta [Eggerthellaceae bacterium]|jgi:indolepyruvate ferredoxin oxidoreductase beta subunit
MLNIVIAGIGGQGSVLAARILAQAALDKGWQVRTAETIGMAQRGGNVASHVRIGDNGEPVDAPLVDQGQADLVIAQEPGEALRALPFLSADGLLVCASTAIPSVSTNLSGKPYRAEDMLAYLEAVAPHFTAVDEQTICREVGSRKVVNIIMLTAAVYLSQNVPYGLRGTTDMAQLRDALQKCIKPRFVELNLTAMDATVRQLAHPAQQ